MKLNRFLGEFAGTAILLIAVVGSSYMAQNLTSDEAVALLINALVTAAILAIIIKGFIGISGSHFNPAVTIALALKRKFNLRDVPGFLIAQVTGGITGVIIANAMFSEALLELSSKTRNGYQVLIGESIATAGLLALALFASKNLVWKLIPLWIFGAYFFTSSTSFANPAVTIARTFTTSPSGIAPESIFAFIVVQILTACAIAVFVKEK